ncbi:sigma-70 family RNA polymerase sigma factor [Pseudomonas aeruginosa]
MHATAAKHIPVSSVFSAHKVVPRLTEDEARTLVAEYQQTGCKRVLERVSLTYMYLCNLIAQRYKQHLEYEELMSECCLILVRCVREYDLSLPYGFSAYAWSRIEREISLYAIKNWSIVQGSTSKAILKAFRALPRYRITGEHLSPRLAEQIASDNDLSLRHVYHAYNLRYGSVARLSAGDDEGEGILQDAIPALQVVGPDVELEKQQEAQAVKAFADNLSSCVTPRELDILQRRHLDDEKQATLQELADEHGVSRERIRQIEAKAMQKVREVSKVHASVYQS